MGKLLDWLTQSVQAPERPAAQAQISTADLVAAADQFIDATLERLRKADDPIWEHQTHMGRILITLAGGGIVASVSVIQLLGERVADVRWAILLPLSWILWSLTILVGISREGWTSSARSLAALVERKRGELRTKIWALDISRDWSTEYDRLLTQVFAEAEAEPANASKVHGALTQAIYWTFAGGVIALVAFAIRNLPF